ncbi:unclassified [Brachyspira pilosicoli WesB]|uniref:Unclassified n=2 Tax=Brachyspira pilosicoli TaxID=52584 RepID=K0JIF0_BRAPL|nr:unclassified [Brachyspira pilosicoli WesB]
MYENHDKDSVVGQVHKIEARDDGLYVTEHQLTDKGLELVKNGEYPLPSGDFVLHYDDNGNIIDLEVFGVSLVNSEGAKDVELVTMNKQGEKIPVYKIKIKQNKGDVKMEKEEIFEMLLDDDFIKELPEEVCKKIIEIRTKKPEEETEEAEMNSEEEEKKQNKEEEEKKETASQNKEEDKQKLIEEITAIMKNAGASEEDISTAVKKIEELASSETAEMNSEEEEDKEKKEEDKKIEVETQNKEEEEEKKESVAMSKFADMIASHEAKTGSSKLVSL